jgi:hypothetical protein
MKIDLFVTLTLDESGRRRYLIQQEGKPAISSEDFHSRRDMGDALAEDLTLILEAK